MLKQMTDAEKVYLVLCRVPWKLFTELILPGAILFIVFLVVCAVLSNGREARNYYRPRR
jgi:hypothetical protein